MGLKINKVYDCNVYIGDESLHGQASEVTCPDIAAVMNEYKALGMVGSVELFNGFDKMEATIKWTYPENAIKKACADFLNPVELMVRSSKAVFQGSAQTGEIPVVIYLTGLPKKHQGGSFKPKEDTELESVFAITYYTEEVDGEEIVELDVLNNIYKVDGVDLLAERRQNLGI
jgi:P2 family phage contractile tail tube protein